MNAPRSSVTLGRRAASAGTTILAALVVFASVTAGLWFLNSRQAPPETTNARVGAGVAGRAQSARTIEGLQQRLRSAPKDWRGWATLGGLYVDRARTSGNPAFYDKAAGAVTRSLKIRSVGNTEGLVAKSRLLAARHDFVAALSVAREAQLINPRAPAVSAVAGDALLELGRYDEAASEYQAMMDVRPDLSSYLRVGYVAELRGDLTKARYALDLAINAATSREDQAFAKQVLGDLLFSQGEFKEAGALYTASLAADPTYAPSLTGRAKVRIARGDQAGGIADLEAIVSRLPTPDNIMLLSEAFIAAGRIDESHEIERLLAVQQQLFRDSGVNIDLEHSLHQADLGSPTLDVARAAFAARPNIVAADTLAWSLAREGRPQEALPYAEQALALGSSNALYVFHRGMIRLALGDQAGAASDLQRALAINPSFSLRWAPVARQELSRLPAGGPGAGVGKKVG